MKKLLVVVLILVSLVGGAGQASADPGRGAQTSGTTYQSAGVTWE